MKFNSLINELDLGRLKLIFLGLKARVTISNRKLMLQA